MKDDYLLLTIIPIILIAGCVSSPFSPTGTFSSRENNGLSVSLVADATEVKTGSPVTFIASLKNLADENATDIKVTLDIMGWNIVDKTKSLNLLLPKEGHKFSWVMYAPKEAGNYSSYVNVFYKMKSRGNIKVRIYNYDHLASLDPNTRKKIEETTAVLLQTKSSNTPITIDVSIQQPFIITQSVQEFPFVVKIKNVGSYEAYNPLVNYQSLGENQKDMVMFSYFGEHLSCDVSNGSIIKLEDGSKGVICKFTVKKEDVGNYLELTANFTVDYAYLTKASTTIRVV